MAVAKEPVKKVEEAAAETQQSINEQVGKFTRGFEDIAAFNQETVEAIFKSGNLAAKVAEELNAETMAFTKKSVEEGVAAAKDLSSVKSVNDLVEKQADYAKSAMESFVRQATRVNELYLAAAKDCAAPINARLSAMGDLVKSQQG